MSAIFIGYPSEISPIIFPVESGFPWAQSLKEILGLQKKMDYTIIGDPVNTAARVESLTREIHKALAFTEDVKNHAQRPWPFLDMGHFNLKGKETGCRIFSVDDELVSDFSTHRNITEQMKKLP